MEKMKWIRKTTTIIFSFCMIMTLLIGCGNKEEKNKNSLLFAYDGSKIYMDEAWIYAKTIQSQYEAWYGSNVWNYQVSDENQKQMTMEEVTKKDMITQIKMVKVLSNKAKKEGIVLSDEEEQKIQIDAHSFMESVNSAELKQTGISEDTLIKVYRENLLADKIYEEIKQKADITITEEQSRQYRTYNLLFETFGYDQNGKRIEYNAKQKAEQKKKAKEAYKKIQDGETNLAVLAEEFKTDQSSEYICGEDGMTAEPYMEMVRILEKGEISGIVETEFGYHIIKMLDPKDKKATERKRQELLEKEQNQYFHEEYAKMTKELEEKWNFAKEVRKEEFEKITFHQNLNEEAGNK